MRIGIITFWGVSNYGTFHQAYALKNVVSKLFPNDTVEVIPYINDTHYSAYYEVIGHYGLRSLISPRFYINTLKRLFEIRNTRKIEKEFLSSYRGLSNGKKRMSYKSLIKEHYDVVILGSDIIWDYTIDLFGKDSVLFGEQLNAKNIFSYAASFGTVNMDTEPYNYVIPCLKKLNSYSVRDIKSQELFLKYTKKNADIVLDPTLIWDYINDKNVDIENEYGDYVVVYGSFFPQDMIEGIVRYSKLNNLKIICMDSGGDKYDWCDANIPQSSLEPMKWAGIIKNCSVIMTCTFHGLMFGLIFKKQICFYKTEFIDPKISYIVEELNIEEPLNNSLSFDEKIEWNWDYNFISSRIDNLKNKSISFLKNSISK